MLERFGIRDRQELVTFLCLILLVVLTPAGKEASQPVVLGIYRSLLLVIIGCYAWRKNRSNLPPLCSGFLAGVIAVVAAMLISMLRWPGSLYESWYVFYESVLFIGAFVALSHGAVERPARWKHAILGAVVLIDIGYIAGALIIGKRPLLGPFVNANYLASFVLPGLAICVATLLLSSSMRLRLAAAGGGLFLLYGIGQTSSRGATLSAGALLAVAGFRMARRRSFSLVRIALAGSILVLLTLAVNPSLVRKFTDRGQYDPFNYARGGIWLGTLSMISQYPVTGVGLGHYYYFGKQFTPYIEGSITHYRKWPNIAHSEYLQYAAEIGVPGAMLLIGLGGYLLVLAWRRSRGIPPEQSITQESALLAATGLTVHALVDNNWTVPVLAAGLAVISQADLLPYGKYPRRPLSLGWRQAFAIALIAVWIDAAMIPAVGLHFNEVGHEAHRADDFKRAEFNHRLALAILPRYSILLDNLGVVYLDEYMKTKEPEYLDRAEILFADSMRENPFFDVPAGHFEAVLVQRLTEDPQRDRTIHRRIAAAGEHQLRADPFNPFVRKNIAEAFYNLGDVNRACEELLKAVEIEPNYIPGHLRLAEWYQEAGKLDESEKYKKQAMLLKDHFKDRPVPDPFDNLLLGRPQAPKQR
jgi:O-antigen ligase